MDQVNNENMFGAEINELMNKSIDEPIHIIVGESNIKDHIVKNLPSFKLNLEDLKKQDPPKSQRDEKVHFDKRSSSNR